MDGFFASLSKGIRDILYPPICLSCKEKLPASDAPKPVCDGCLQKIKKNRPPFCLRCGRGLDEKSAFKELCGGCRTRTPAFDRAFAPCVYEGTVRTLIQACKYRQKDYIAAMLGDMLIEFIREYSLPIEYVDIIMPIPLHAARRREREFNQAELISRRVGREFLKPVMTDCLMRLRNTPAQAALSSDRRTANVAGAFRVADAPEVENRNILLIDDVLTTGATASEAAAALKNAGANIVFILTVAN